MEDEVVTDEMVALLEESLAIKHLDLKWLAGWYRLRMILGQPTLLEEEFMMGGIERGRNWFLNRPEYAGDKEVVALIRKAEEDYALRGSWGWRKILLADCALWCNYCAAGNVPRRDPEMRGYSHRFFLGLRKKQYCRASEDIEKFRLYE